MTFRQTEDIIWIDEVPYNAASLRTHFDVSLPTGMVQRTYNVIADGIEEQSDGRTAFPQTAPSLPYDEIFAAVAQFELLNPPDPEPDEDELARLAAINAARTAVALAGITITYGITLAGEPAKVRMWCRNEIDYYNYGVMSQQLREATEFGFADRVYRISTMDGGWDCPNRATLRFILAKYLEAAQMLYEAII